MNKLKRIQGFGVLLLAFGFMLSSCTKNPVIIDTVQPDSGISTWLVPFEDILFWGDPTDEILSIENPEFMSITESPLQADDRVFVFLYDGQIRLYPITVLGQHEIVNDQIGELSFAVNYCPITLSGMNWNRTINGEVTEFGVSGMLFHDNLIPYDRNTKSNWSQMLAQCVNGKLIGERPEMLALPEYPFGMISAYFPDALVLKEPNGSTVNVFGNPSLQEKSAAETMMGVAGSDRALLFAYSDFENGIQVYNTSLSSRFLSSKVVVAGSAENQFMVAWENPDYPLVEFTAVNNEFPVIMQDNLGNRYDLLGQAVLGPDKGKQLPAARAYRALEFAWASMFETLIYFADQ